MDDIKLHKQVQHMMVDMDNCPSRAEIALHFKEVVSTVSMAINGTRTGPKYQALNKSILEYLRKYKGE